MVPLVTVRIDRTGPALNGAAGPGCVAAGDRPLQAGGREMTSRCPAIIMRVRAGGARARTPVPVPAGPRACFPGPDPVTQ